MRLSAQEILAKLTWTFGSGLASDPAGRDKVDQFQSDLHRIHEQGAKLREIMPNRSAFIRNQVRLAELALARQVATDLGIHLIE